MEIINVIGLYFIKQIGYLILNKKKRQYCSRRARRIRQSLHFLHGKSKFQKREIDIKSINDRRFQFQISQIINDFSFSNLDFYCLFWFWQKDVGVMLCN